MTNPILRQALFISLLGHVTLFGMFSFSFGPKIPEVNFANVSFWGAILRSADLMNNRNFDIGYKTGGFIGRLGISVLDKIKREDLLASRGYFPASRHSGIPPITPMADSANHAYGGFRQRRKGGKAGEAGSPALAGEKPPVCLPFNQEKRFFSQKLLPISAISARKEPAIMFYPRLPYHFALYFKDRQTAHIELMFQVISGAQRNSVLVKRRISSGNLEADLLSMRYISRYLFIQQRAFAPNKWQIVRIDLSTVND